MLAKLPPADILVTNTFWLPALAFAISRRAGKIAVHVARMPRGQYKLYRGVDRFQILSRPIQEAILAEQPALAPRVRFFPNPIDTGIYTPPPRPRRSDDEQTILYTGRLHPEKGLHVLLDAFALLSRQQGRLKLRLVGPWRTEHGGGGADYLEQLRRQAAGLNVEFGEPIFEPKQLAAVYQSAHFYCYPTLAAQGEASPVAPLEAMATGLVPVVSDIPQFREYLRPGVNGLVFAAHGAGAASELARTLLQLVSDPVEVADMSAQAARTAAAYSYARVADLYLEDFHQLRMKKD
jgi:glycosyltransferase involved in cell wall biosynthesis